jgi:predicted ATP-dependent endonuclease of OLD family
MKLLSFRVTNYRSVEDSGEVPADSLVCLVGKNEAGKTAILQALAGLNPHPSTSRTFDRESACSRWRRAQHVGYAGSCGKNYSE